MSNTLDTVRTTLAELTRPFADARSHYCQVEAATLSGSRCTLAGAVLDADTAATILLGLAARHPNVTFDAAGMRVLAGPEPQMRTVATNITGLYAGPSFRAEQLSQLVNGARVEVLEEQEPWVRVRLSDGYLGWTYTPYLSVLPPEQPTHMVVVPLALLHESADAKSSLVGRTVAGTRVRSAGQAGGWVRVLLAGDARGWVSEASLRIVAGRPQDEGGPSRQMVVDALQFVGTPYLWGGCSAFGIDCSGFVQLVHILAGIGIPRDADMQKAAGRQVEPPLQPGDLVFFGSGGGHRPVSHVGLSLGGWSVVHASRARNGVFVDDIESLPDLRDNLLGAASFVRT